MVVRKRTSSIDHGGSGGEAKGFLQSLKVGMDLKVAPGGPGDALCTLWTPLTSLSSIIAQDFDAYAKPLDDFRVKTSSGAAVSIVSYILICLLLISEFVDWQTVQILPSLEVDRARKEKMRINLNITFPKIPCFCMSLLFHVWSLLTVFVPVLSIDVMDVAGEHQNDVDHSIIKSRLDQMGNAIHMEKMSEIGKASEEKAVAQVPDANYCGSCYGGVPPEGKQCCNTCEEVRKAYADKAWSFNDPDGIEQCVREGWSKKVKEQANEGCNLDGHLEVNKVAGNFHFAPGKSFQQASMHVHDLHAYLSGTAYDFSHKVESLSFGQALDFTNPLDGVKKDTPNGAYMYQYFIKVVSTKYKFRNGTTVNTNQIAVTEHERDTKQGGSIGLPGVFFNFDISPMLVMYTEYKKPFAHFLTDVCAIVGGIFTVAGILDSLIYTAERSLKRKMELGKAT
ncbi:hypothetical protein HK101_001766, partial [Irineochytrium annulatum]